MDNSDILNCLIKYHPDVFIILLLKYNPNIAQLRSILHFRNDWQEELPLKGFQRNSSDIKSIDDIKDSIEKKFFNNNYTAIDWEYFSTYGNIKWDVPFIEKYMFHIYWGINTESKRKDYEEKTYLDDYHKKRLEVGGLSINPHINITPEIFEKYIDKWDFYALAYNPSLSMNISSFIKLKRLYIDSQIDEDYKNELLRWGEYYTDTIGIVSGYLVDHDYWGNVIPFIKDYKFLICNNIFSNIENESKSDVLKFLKILSEFPAERFRLECLYSYFFQSIKKPYMVFIETSFDNLNVTVNNWFSYATEHEIIEYLEKIDLKRFEDVLTKLQIPIKHSYTELNKKAKSITDNWLKEFTRNDTGYCPNCQQNPCMCSHSDNY